MAKYAYIDIETTFDGANMHNQKEPILIVMKYKGSTFVIKHSEHILHEFWNMYRKLRYPKLMAHNGIRFDYKYLLAHIRNAGKYPSISYLGNIHHPYAMQFFIDQFSIQWHDSTALLPIALKKIGESIGMLKGNFEDVFYRSDEQIDIESDKYKRLVEYCIRDVEILEHHKKVFPNDIKVKRTIASTALNFMFDVKNIVRIAHPELAQAYRGGQVECYMPTLKHAFMADINSQYPTAMLSMPNPYAQPTATRDRNTDMLGLYYVDIDYYNDEHPSIGVYSESGQPGVSPIPKTNTTGTLKYPIFKNCKMWLASAELDILDTMGASYTIKYGVELPIMDMSSKIKRIYKLRKDDPSASLAWKLILNSAYGKFGQHDIKENIIEIYDPRILKLAADKKIDELQEELSAIAQRISSKNNDRKAYAKTLNKVMTLIIENKTECAYQNYIVAANITAGARKLLHKLNTEAGVIAYNDTDSLITDDEGRQQLSKYMGPAMGQLKFVDEGEAIIMARKAYEFVGKFRKHKGIPAAWQTQYIRNDLTRYTAITHGNKEATMKEYLRVGSQVIPVNKTVNMDLNYYRRFNGMHSKPYLLQGFSQTYKEMVSQVRI